jgi:hypothetical protein
VFPVEISLAMTYQTVLVRGPRGEAHVLALVGLTERTCQVTDNKGIIMMSQLDLGRVAIVHRSDVFAIAKNLETGDFPDWTSLTPI